MTEALRQPDAEELAAVVEELEMPLSAAELEVLGEAAGDLFEDYEELARLEPPKLVGSARERHVVDAGRRPADGDNPYNGWAWRCRIEGGQVGPLAGRTVGVKDSIAVAGLPLRNGSDFFAGFVPADDATVVTRLLDAGAVIAGKTAVPSFCFEGAGIYGETPPPQNPAGPDHFPGGSSSGSAALVAAGEVDLALGGDQGGSIRIPASWCGCVGHKPTHGLVPYTGALPMDPTFDHLGPLAGNVSDCATMMDVLAGPDGLDPRQGPQQPSSYSKGLDDGVDGLRVGLLREGFGIEGVSHPDVDAAVRKATLSLTAQGARIEEVSVPLHRQGAAIWDAVCLQGATDLMRASGLACGVGGYQWVEAAEFIGAHLQERAASFPPPLKLTLILGRLMTRRNGRIEYAKAQNLALWLAREYDRVLADFDVLVMPTTPMKAPRRPGAEMSERDRIILAVGIDSSRNVAPFDVSGHPSLSVPCGRSEGLPIGLSVVGKKFDDATVLRVGRSVEVSVSGNDQ